MAVQNGDAITLHRRTNSKESTSTPPDSPLPYLNGNGHSLVSRSRVLSQPLNHQLPPSAGPHLTTFPPSSPFRNSFAQGTRSHSHSRTRSVSTPFYPSPLSPNPINTSFPSSTSAPALTPGNSVPESPDRERASPRRHARLHSRNLSVFFPRPGAASTHTTIDEDGAQELSFSPALPAGRGTPTPLNSNFSFGARPPGSAPMMSGGSGSGSAARRGHHHKHSMSHNFFSFLEPGAAAAARADAEHNEQLHTQPTPVPVSPWQPVSKPSSAPAISPLAGEIRDSHDSTGHPLAAPVALAQFFLGGWLWVAGQQCGSLSATGLGYWVVFDSFGVALAGAIPKWLSKSSPRRFYGNSRLAALLAFAQAVYLLFAAVYVCKEAIEHLLLSVGEGHHHHHGDEQTQITGIAFPFAITLCAFTSIAGTALCFNNHAQLIQSTLFLHFPNLH
jgi:hypothetical protein